MLVNAEKTLNSLLTQGSPYGKLCARLEGFPSGQREQTVNLPRKLRWFESVPLHHFLTRGKSRVWYNGRTSAFQADDAGSIPATRSKFTKVEVANFAQVAQLVEHTLGKGEVGGSNPLLSSIG